MLPPEVQEQLANLTRLLDAHRAILRTVRPEALHFTLRFLGETTGEQEREAIAACQAATEGFAPFALAIGGFGAFPNARRPRVIWLGLRDGAGPITALQRRVEDELLRRGVVTGREQFTPHLTLARVRPETKPAERAALGAALAALPAVVQARCDASAVSLVQSHLGPGGSRYTALGSWPHDKNQPSNAEP
jgi:2'-5' RNA ligase